MNAIVHALLFATFQAQTLDLTFIGSEAVAVGDGRLLLVTDFPTAPARSGT
jgi:hypothetical protein